MISCGGCKSSMTCSESSVTDALPPNSRSALKVVLKSSSCLGTPTMPNILSLASERCYIPSLFLTEPRRLAGPRVLAHPIGAAGSGDRAAHPAVGEDELEERLRPGLDAEFLQGFELASGRRVADETPAAQGDYHDNPSILQTVRGSKNIPPISKEPSK